MNASRHILTQGFLQGPGINASNGAALWIETPEDDDVFVVQAGSVVPGYPTLTFFGIFQPTVIADSGRVLFGAYVKEGAGDSHGAIFTWGDGQLDLIARHGDPVPGLPEFPLDGFAQGKFQGSMDDSGNAIFEMEIKYTGNSRHIVFGYAPGQGVFPIAVPGTQLFVGGEVVTVHTALLPELSQSTSPTSYALTDDGQFVFLIRTDDFEEIIAVGDFQAFEEGFFGPPPPPACPADLSGDGQVNSIDLNAVLGAFGSSSPSGDVNGSGFVDSVDLNLVLALFGQACPKG